MEEITFLENPLNVYLLKQMNFKTFIKGIQQSLNSKEYIKKGTTIDDFVKSKWNISKTQAYRYLLCAKIIDQLEGFEIQPNYERLCRSLNKYAKTSQQIKLLWGTILNKVHENVDLITSSLVTKTWNELCRDKRFSHICHYEESIMNRIENTIKEHSKKLKQRQLKSLNINTNIDTTFIRKQNKNRNCYLISPEVIQTPIIPSIPSNNCINNENTTMNQYKIEDQYEKREQFLLFSNNNVNTINNNMNNNTINNITINNDNQLNIPKTQINIPLSNIPLSPLSTISPLSPTLQNNEATITISPNEYNNQYTIENQIIPVYYSVPTQQTIIYY